MARYLKKVKPGDDPAALMSARWHNWVTEITRRAEAHLNRTGQGKAQKIIDEPCIAWIQNKTGETRDAFDVVGIGDDVPIKPQDNEVSFWRDCVVTAVTPDIDKHTRKFAVLKQPLAADECGEAWIMGLTPCFIKVNSEDDEFATIQDDETFGFESGSSGIPIWWKDKEENADADGYRWAMVLMGAGSSSDPLTYGITTAAISAGGSGTVALWEEGSSGSFSNTGITETAYAPWILTTGSIAANKRVEMVRSKKSGRLICKNWEC